MTKKDYRYEKLLEIYFTFLLNGGPDALNHYTMGKHTEGWKLPLEDIYLQVGVYQEINFQLKYILIEIVVINSDDSVPTSKEHGFGFAEFFTFLMG